MEKYDRDFNNYERNDGDLSSPRIRRAPGSNNTTESINLLLSNNSLSYAADESHNEKNI